MGELLIFELDGGSWAILDPLLKEGRLPHIASLIRRGVAGVLHSVPPLVSPALWTTIYTGQPREKHGVFTFDATSQEASYDRLWDIAHAQGIACGVCSSLVTWPPYDVGGFMIPDIMARDTRTIPPQFAPLQELALNYPRGQQSAGYSPSSYIRHAIGLSRAGVSVRTMAALGQEVLSARLLRRPYMSTYWRRVLLLQRLYTDAFLQLYRAYRPGLATYHFHAVDTLSHRYWRDHEQRTGQEGQEKTSCPEVISTAYQAADRALGLMLKAADPETTVLLISDHGFRTTPEERSWYTANLPRWVQVLGLEGVATPTRLGKQHFLYFKEAAHVEAVAETLRSTVFKETNAPVLPRVVNRDTSLFFLPPRHRSEGLTVVIPGRAELPFEELFKDTGHAETGIHDPEGIVVLAGPPMRRGSELKKASILDVAPTALALLGLPIARDMEGRVWTEALQSEFVKQHPLTFVDTYRREAETMAEAELDAGDTEILFQRLGDLGYL